MGLPNPDPGEEYPHVNTQLFDTVLPATNATSQTGSMEAPFNAPPAGTAPTMDGFIADYVNNIERGGGKPPTIDVAEQIMGGFSPEQLPVLSTLAREFAVFDAWFAAVPSQTYCNRSFFHASTSHGFVTNKHGGGYDKWLDADAVPTIFNRLEEAGISWKIYFDELQLVSLTGVQHAPSLEEYWRTEHFGYMSEFYEDAAAGRLPAYAFIEPRMVYNHNDFHPPFGVFRSSEFDGEMIVDSAVSDVRAGEKLVASVYEAIKHSDTADGSNAMNTLLLITFDEHGGTYDHVPPPERDSADGGCRPRGDGFHVRPARMPRTRDRRVGVHPRGHDHPRRDAPWRGDRDIVAPARTAAAHAPRCRRERPLRRGESATCPEIRAHGRSCIRCIFRRIRRPTSRSIPRPRRTRTSP